MSGLTSHGASAPVDPGRDGDMGRGRQKAKDAKIARELKYTNHGGDLRELERELTGTAKAHAPAPAPVKEETSDEFVDRWASEDDD